VIKQFTHSFAGRLIAVVAGLLRWRCRVSNDRKRAVDDGGARERRAGRIPAQAVEARSIPYAKSGK
jgi:hypothetical protein